MIACQELGGMVMDDYASDQVAYVRFASVYREFKDLDDFMTELKAVIKSDGDDMRPTALINRRGECPFDRNRIAEAINHAQQAAETTTHAL